MVISCFGQAFSKVQFGDTVLAFNPISKDFDSKAPKFGADIALISLNDEAFNGSDSVAFGTKQPFVIDGPGEYEIGGIFVQGFKSEGADGRFNTIYTVLLENMTILHLGALANASLSPETIEEIGVVDIVFAPIGGDKVLGAKEAYKLASSFEPKLIIPTMWESKSDESMKVFLKEASAGDATVVDKLSIKRKDIEAKEGEVILIQS